MADPPPSTRSITADDEPPNEGLAGDRIVLVPPEEPTPAQDAPEEGSHRDWTAEEAMIVLAQQRMWARQQQQVQPPAPASAPPAAQGPAPMTPPAHAPPDKQDSVDVYIQARGQVDVQITTGGQGAPAAALAPAPAASPATRDPFGFIRRGFVHLFDERHTHIKFLPTGLRPCDHAALWTAHFGYERIKAPLNMTVEQFVRRVGYQFPQRTLQEMVELRSTPDGTQFGAGRILQRVGGTAAWTLEQLGWDETRDEADAVWVVLGPAGP